MLGIPSLEPTRPSRYHETIKNAEEFNSQWVALRMGLTVHENRDKDDINRDDNRSKIPDGTCT